MDLSSDLMQTTESIFKPVFLPYLSTWLESANKDEIKGLKIIKAIVKHKGQKRFKRHSKNEKFDFSSAEVDIRRKTMQSYYSTQYNTQSSEKYHVSDILKYKRISEQPYSNVLKDSALNFIENWIALKDEAEYLDLLVVFLQGFHAVAKIHKNALATNNQEHFHWFSKEERNRANLPASPLNTTAPLFFSKNQKSSSVVTEKIQKGPMKSFYEPRFYQDRMIQKMRGSGDFINWVHDKSFSMYQGSFASKINNCPNQVVKPANSSTVVRVLPINEVIR